MKTLILLLLICLSPYFLFSRPDDSLVAKKVKENNVFLKKKIEVQIKIAKEYYSQAEDNISAARIIIDNISENSSSVNADKEMATVFINKSKKYTIKLDSVYKISCRYKDSIKANDVRLTKLTGKHYNSYPWDTIENLMKSTPDINNSNDVNKADDEKNLTYTVQIGSDKRNDQFKNIQNVKVIKCKDDYYRYITGEFKTYEEASKLQQTYYKAGYKDCFVRSVQSIELLKK